MYIEKVLLRILESLIFLVRDIFIFFSCVGMIIKIEEKGDDEKEEMEICKCLR